MHQDIEDFIKQCGNSAEIKRGLAVKQDLEGKERVQIADILCVHPAFVSKWRLIYDEFGVNGLYSTHQGGAPRSFLTKEQRKQTLTHIGLHIIFGPKDLQLYLEKAFDVRFKWVRLQFDVPFGQKYAKLWQHNTKLNRMAA